MTMDENAVRLVLERAAATDGPRSTVDVARARRTGRRRLRLWRVILPGASAAAVAAIAALAGGMLPLGPAAGGTAARHGPHPVVGSRFPWLTSAPATFSPLVPYAAFGWLPAGFSIAGAYGDMMHEMSNSVASTHWVPLQAQDPAINRTLTGSVGAAGICHLTGQVAWPPAGPPGGSGSQSAAGPLRPGQRRYPHGLACEYSGPGLTTLPLTGPAPAAGGGRGFWAVNDGLVWEYAPGAWAELFLSAIHGAAPMTAAGRVLLAEVAAHIRYRSAARLAFPFRLRGVPASWHLTDAWLTTSGDRLVGMTLDLGPAADAYALSISAQPAGGPSGCTWDPTGPGTYQRVIIDGAAGILRSVDLPGKHFQSLCSASVDGLRLDISVDRSAPGTSDRPLPGGAGFGRALVIFFDHLKLLGPNPAGWTTRPLG